ncbi:hypothetical protein B0H11DRAFT_936775 [Mycena galericulata]|nr:hypothetical protein B0H11DRAFT_936775 [Mycena galericulata]
MTIQLLDLPTELLVLVLNSLTLSDLTVCLATNRRLKSIVDGSTLLQYRLATQAACVEDNPWNTEIHSAHRLVALKKRQTAFAELNPNFIRSIPMHNFPILWSYALSGGIFAMMEPDKKALRWASLSETSEQETAWERLEVDEVILEFGLAVPEADLVVVLSSTKPLDFALTSSPIIKLRFYEMSTQSPHRWARESVLQLPIAVVGCPDFSLDICGPHVAILTVYSPLLQFNPLKEHLRSRLLIYDWRQGRLQMDLRASSSAVVFLSPGIILLSRLETGTLELWAVPDSPEHMSAGPEISLRLPRLLHNGRYHSVKVECNPKGPESPAVSHQLFHSSFADSVVMLQVMIRHDTLDDEENAWVIHEKFLIIPRRALLQQIPPIGHTGSRERVWAEWGPSISRWIHASAFAGYWPTIMCGQRCVLRDIGTPDVPSSFVILDFNRYTCRKAQLRQADDSDEVVEPERDAVDLHVFEEEVNSQLCYVVTESQQKCTYDGILLDEEWIVGIHDKTDTDGKFSIDVWHLG